MQTVYIAEDGTSFDTYYDCKDYEDTIMLKNKEYPTLTDEKGKIISPTDLFSRYDDVNFIFASNGEQLKNLKELFEHCGVVTTYLWDNYINSNKKSSWFWEDDDCYSGWKNLDDELEYYEKLKNLRDKILGE